MLNIRLARTGRKRDAHFRVVVSDSAHGRVGRILETVGWYHPRMPNDAEGRLHLDRSRARYWLDRGARPSDTVRSFLKNLPEEPAEEDAPGAASEETPETAAEAAPEAAAPSTEAPEPTAPTETAASDESTPAESASTDSQEAAAPDASSEDSEPASSESPKAAD